MVLVSWHSRAILLRPLFPSFWGRDKDDDGGSGGGDDDEDEDEDEERV